MDVELINAKKPDIRVPARALVDTGATYSVIPANIVKKLELENLGYVEVKTASGSEKLQETEVKVKAFDRERVTPALVSEKVDTPLIGVVTLEILRLKIDPTTGKAEGLPLLLYLTTYST
ncbi:MAG: clan AA aspartic protease [archaeon]|nr:clan AA aspartic protease [archaeon]MCP8314263.1 clan AA aspartic protease [archaeon]MCP8318088.1 clan AA aspartic protease [archaeon]MCP8319956.1 clan AA aspartic protease [archaeon]